MKSFLAPWYKRIFYSIRYFFSNKKIEKWVDGKWIKSSEEEFNNVRVGDLFKRYNGQYYFMHFIPIPPIEYVKLNFTLSKDIT